MRAFLICPFPRELACTLPWHLRLRWLLFLIFLRVCISTFFTTSLGVPLCCLPTTFSAVCLCPLVTLTLPPPPCSKAYLSHPGLGRKISLPAVLCAMWKNIGVSGYPRKPNSGFWVEWIPHTVFVRHREGRGSHLGSGEAQCWVQPLFRGVQNNGPVFLQSLSRYLALKFLSFSFFPPFVYFCHIFQFHFLYFFVLFPL